MKKKVIVPPKLVDFVVTARKYTTTLNRKHEMRKPWVKPIEEEIYSQLPGTIISIDVEVGQEVKMGDTMLVHEAMKMLNRVLAPFDGKIKAIHVEPGMQIKKDFLMLEFEQQNEEVI